MFIKLNATFYSQGCSVAHLSFYTKNWWNWPRGRLCYVTFLVIFLIFDIPIPISTKQQHLSRSLSFCFSKKLYFFHYVIQSRWKTIWSVKELLKMILKTEESLKIIHFDDIFFILKSFSNIIFNHVSIMIYMFKNNYI